MQEEVELQTEAWAIGKGKGLVQEEVELQMEAWAIGKGLMQEEVELQMEARLESRVWSVWVEVYYYSYDEPSAL